jgi:DNA adenine methylase
MSAANTVNTMAVPILKYPGSKWMLANWIIRHMPKHQIYLEPFFGSGAILFNKKPSKTETINDIDGNVTNLFRVIREQPEELARLVYFTPWARDEYIPFLTSHNDSESFIKTDNDLEDARRFLVRCWMAFNGATSDRTGWASDVAGKERSGPTRRWNRVPEQIIRVADRLKLVQIENQPAVKLIERYRSEETLIYADPPYVSSSRNSRAYKFEMSDNDHLELLEALDNHPGPVLLSGYASELYDNRLKHWRRETATGRAMGYKKREEVLWINHVASRMIDERQLSLF